jgi:hypothetical protein
MARSAFIRHTADNSPFWDAATAGHTCAHIRHFVQASISNS